MSIQPLNDFFLSASVAKCLQIISSIRGEEKLCKGNSIMIKEIDNFCGFFFINNHVLQFHHFHVILDSETRCNRDGSVNLTTVRFSLSASAVK